MRHFQSLARCRKPERSFQPGVMIAAGIIVPHRSQVDQAIQITGNSGESAAPKVIVGPAGLLIDEGGSRARLGLAHGRNSDRHYPRLSREISLMLEKATTRGALGSTLLARVCR